MHLARQVVESLQRAEIAVLVELALARARKDGCNHDPDAPRLVPEAFGKRAHRFARAVVERFGKLIYHQRRTKVFRADWPELLARESGDEQGAYEGRRSERLEAVCLVLGSLMRHLDFGSSRVILDAEVDRGVAVTQIAEEAQLHPRRAERALRCLRVAGIVSFTELRRQRVDGCGTCRSTVARCKCSEADKCPLWVSDAAIRKLSPRLFAKLGQDIVAEYRKIRTRLNRRQPKLPPPGKPIDLRVPSGRARARATQPAAAETAKTSRAVHEIIAELIAKGLSAEQAFDEIRRMRRQE
jgi:DNA-binding transcriptional regulator YhcF (GntR family)